MANPALQSLLRHLRRRAARDPSAALADAQLLRRFVDNCDEAAFEVLVWRHGPMVLGCCRKQLGHDQDTEDAFQATFLVLARKAASIRQGQSLAGWLHRVATNAARRRRSQVRSRQARERLGLDLSAVAGGSPGLTDVEDRDRWGVVAEELERLPARYRLPLIACHLQGRTHEEAARDLGRPFGSMSGDLARGCALLRGRLVRRGVNLSAAALTALLADRAHAAVSLALVVPTVTAALKFSAGAALSQPAASLAHGVVQSMYMSNVKVAAGLTLVLTALAAGTAGLARQTPTAPALPLHQAGEARAPAQVAAPRLDALGDPLPEYARLRLGTARLRHGGPVTASAFLPDGKTAVTAGSNSDANLRIWDVATGRELRRIEVITLQIDALTVTPDGKTVLATLRDRTVRQWDLATGAELRRLRGHQGQVTSLAVTPDGRVAVTGSADGTARVWDLATGQTVAVFDGHKAPVQAVAVAPDGKTAASGGRDKTVRVWDLAGVGEQRAIAHASEVSAVTFARDGRRLAAADQSGAVRVWDLATGDEIIALRADNPPVNCLAFAPDGKALAYGSQRGPVRMWDLPAGRPSRTFDGPPAVVRTLAFSGDGATLLTGGGDRRVRFLDVATGKDRFDWPGHAGAVQGVAVTADGKAIVTCSNDGAIVWDLAAGKPLNRFPAPHQNVKSIAFSPDAAEMAAAGQSGIIRIYDRVTGKIVRQLGNHSDIVTALAWSGDGRTVASAGNDGTVQIWDAAAPGKPRAVIKNAAVTSRVLSLSHSGRLVASAQTQEEARGPQEPVRVWDTTTGTELYQLTGHQAEVVEVKFSTGDRTLLATGARDGVVCFWDMVNGQRVSRLDGQGTPAWAVAFTPDGRTVATGMANTVRLWETDTGRELARFEGHNGLVEAVAFFDNGRSLVSGCTDGTAMVWDATARTVGQAVAAAPESGVIRVEPKHFEFNVPAEIRSSFAARAGRLCFYRNGQAQAVIEVPADGEYEVVVKAAGDPALDERARFQVFIDGESIGPETPLTADDAKEYTLTAKLKAGSRALVVKSSNVYAPNEYARNLYLYEVVLRRAK